MKKLLLAAVFLALMARVSGAVHLSCPINNYGFYVDTFRTKAQGCTIDDKVFYGFTYTHSELGGAPPVLAGDINVIPLVALSDPGFLFTNAWAVGSNQTQDSVLLYNVGTLSGANLIIDNELQMLGSGFSGTGIARVDETKCIGAEILSCPGDSLVNIGVINTAGMTDLAARIIFPPVNTLGIFKDISVTGGTDGTAAISGVINRVSQVPEPSTLLLLGSGLAGWGIVALRRHRRKGGQTQSN